MDKLLGYRNNFKEVLPQIILSLLVLIAGIRLLQVDIGTSWYGYILNIISGQQGVNTQKIPSLIIGVGLVLMSFGLLLRSRVSWAMSIFLLFMAGLSVILTQSHKQSYLIYCIVATIGLIASTKRFDKSSLIASAIFAFTSVLMLITYATFGNYYLGSHFSPPINDLVTSLYYSMVTMSTVGYGDISPKSPEAKLFTVSVILMGLTVFATSITSLAAPILNNSLSKVITHKGRKMKRKQHFVVIGNTSLAINTSHELVKRGHHITRILPASKQTEDATDIFDIVYGEPSKSDTLLEAGVDKAKAVLSMMEDDSENAFVILAVKEMSKEIKTIVSVNESENMDKINLTHPDIVISPQVFGGQITAMFLSDENISHDFVMNSIFRKIS